MSEKCVLHVLLVWQNDAFVGGLLDCAQAHKETRCLQHYALTMVYHYRQGVKHNQICRFFFQQVI